MSVPFKSDAIVVRSGGASDPKLVAGTGDPTTGVTAPEGSLYLRYVASGGQAFIKAGPGDTDWSNLASGGGSTLDAAYDFGGAGAGRAIAADAGAVQIDATTGDTQAALVINRSPGSSAAALGIDMQLGANVSASGSGLSVTDAGAGNSIQVAKSNSGAAVAVTLSNAGAQALNVTVSAAPTSVSPISVVANTTGTTASLVSLSKIPGSATAGAALAVSMGANTTGPGITVSTAGTAPAIQVPAGSVDITHSGARALTVATTFANDIVMSLRNLSVTGYSMVGFWDSANTFQGYLGYSNASSVVGPGHFNFYSATAGHNWQFWNSVDNIPGVIIVSAGAAAPKIQMANGSSATVSAANTGAIRYNSTTQTFQTSVNGGAYTDIGTGGGGGMSIGGTVTSGTAGSVLYVASGPALAQDNSNFFWDSTNKRLGIGTAASPQMPLDVRGNVSGSVQRITNINTGGNSSVEFYASDATTSEMVIGYGGSASAVTHIQSLPFLYSSSSADFVFANSTQNSFRFGMTSGSAFVAMADGVSAAVSAANTGRIRYNNTTHTFQASLNGGAYTDMAAGSMAVGGTVTSGTAGSMLFVGSGPVLAQDNTNLFWDNTNKRLGIGTNAPGLALNVTSGAAADAMGVQNTNASGYSSTAYYDNATPSAALKMSLGYANSSASDSKVRGRAFVHYESDLTFATTSSNNAYFNVGNGFVGLGVFDGSTTTPQTRLHVYGSENPTIVRIQSTAAPGSGRFEFYSDPITSVNQWRPGYFQSEDEGSFTGSVVFYTNGTGSGNKFGTVEAARFTNGSLQMAAGSAATVSVANRGKFRYNESTQKMQLSANGGAYADLLTSAAAAYSGTWSSGSAPYAAGSIVSRGLFLFGSTTSTSVDPCFDFGNLGDNSVWGINGTGVSQNSTTGIVTLINAVNSQDTNAIYKTNVSGWDKRRLIIDLEITGSADGISFGILDGSLPSTTTASGGMSAVTGFWGVDIEIFSSGSPGYFSVTNGVKASQVADTNSNITNAGTRFDRWYLDLVDNGAGAGTMTMTLYRNGHPITTGPIAWIDDLVQLAQWTITRPTFTNWKFAIGAHTGGANAVFAAKRAYARYTGTDWNTLSRLPVQQ